MIFVPYLEPKDPEWSAWFEKARRATQALKETVSEGGRAEINESLYKEPRTFLLGAFHNKCAYCEVDISRFTVDVEHYRPKGRVTDLRRKIVRIKSQRGNESNHPGYYWLAYDWANLLPSCEFCNRKRHHQEQQDSWGKETCFPVQNRRYASSPTEDIAGERPMLLHPRFDDPDKHLDFLIKEGPSEERICLVKGKTRRGKITVCVLGLYDERLNRARLQAYEEGYNQVFELVDFARLLGKASKGRRQALEEGLADVRNKIRRIWFGYMPHAAFGRLGIRTAALRISVATDALIDGCHMESVSSFNSALERF
jgi:uncharacterized protein (TIGR02646 family)